MKITRFMTGTTLLAAGLFGALAHAATDSDLYRSDAALDSHVIFQDFSFSQPYDSDTYTTLADHARALADLGITDVWFAPPYRALQDGFETGYSVSDRYDLGEFERGHGGAKATKYGTATELRSAIEALHAQNMNALADLAMNQMLGFPTKQVVRATAVDIFGHPADDRVVDRLIETYAKGGGPGQEKYGLIPQWNAGLQNGETPQQLGIDRVMLDAGGQPYRYYGPNDSRNHLPDWLADTPAARTGTMNVTDTYLLVDGYYGVAHVGTGLPTYRPYLLYYQDPHPDAVNTDYLNYMRDHGFAGDTDAAVRQAIIDSPNQPVVDATNAYLGAQPGYSAASETFAAYRFQTPDNDISHVNQNVLQYEFLVGNDLDNSNPRVQEEQLNWQRFLLDQYGFDGFRFDAAGHFNTDVLRQSAELMRQRYASDIDNHLAVLENYVPAQRDFEASNHHGQLVYDAALYNALHDGLETPASGISFQQMLSASYVDRLGGTGAPVPNWSFVNNHDQEQNLISSIPLSAAEAGDAAPGSVAYKMAQMEKYDTDRGRADKRYATYNIPAAYAIILTNKDTVPTVFYGDLYEADKAYMQVETPYYDDIAALLKIRKRYVSGDQHFQFYPNDKGHLGEDLMASVRTGIRRNEGVAAVIGDNPYTDQDITIDLGRRHALQLFRDALHPGASPVWTDWNGRLATHVSGQRTAQVHGVLQAWVPVAGSIRGVRSILFGHGMAPGFGLFGAAQRQPSTRRHAGSGGLFGSLRQQGWLVHH